MSNSEEENDHYNINRNVNLSLIEDIKGYIKMILEHKVLSMKVKISSSSIKEILDMAELYDFLVEQKIMPGIFDVLEDTPQKPAYFCFDGYEYDIWSKTTPRNVVIVANTEKFKAEYTELSFSNDSGLDTITIRPTFP